MEIEADHMDVLRKGGYEDVAQFIRSTTLIEVNRYALFKVGVDRLGVEDAMKCGVHVTIETIAKMRAPTAERIATVVERTEAFKEVRGGVVPSEQTAKALRLELDERSDKPNGTVRIASELQQLRAENAKLKAENKALKRRVDELEGAEKGGRRKKAA